RRSSASSVGRRSHPVVKSVPMKTYDPPVRHRLLRLSRAGLISLAILCSDCERMLQWTAGHTLGEEMKRLEQSDRLVIEGGAAELQSEVTIVDRSTIRDVLALFERYPRDWIIISGAPGDYLLI